MGMISYLTFRSQLTNTLDNVNDDHKPIIFSLGNFVVE